MKDVTGGASKNQNVPSQTNQVCTSINCIPFEARAQWGKLSAVSQLRLFVLVTNFFRLHRLTRCSSWPFLLLTNDCGQASGNFPFSLLVHPSVSLLCLFHFVRHIFQIVEMSLAAPVCSGSSCDVCRVIRFWPTCSSLDQSQLMFQISRRTLKIAVVGGIPLMCDCGCWF